MAITNLIPWKKNDHTVAMRHNETDPFRQLHREINHVFNRMLGEWPGPMNLLDRRLGNWIPQVDMSETEKEVRLTAELPGIEEKDLDVSLVDGALTIKGEKREEHEEEKGDLHHSERQYGMFERTIPLPAGVAVDKVQASFKKGVLKIILPKTKEAQSNRRLVPVQAS
jgi:HSP20 family protein